MRMPCFAVFFVVLGSSVAGLWRLRFFLFAVGVAVTCGALLSYILCRGRSGLC